MKLSVCIPVYNFDVRQLVYDLKKEIRIKGLEAEIVLIDDASDDRFNEIHTELQDEVENFIYLTNNVGRSKIRNLFLKYTEGAYLLFLDCDAKIDSAHFLSNYLVEIEQNKEVEVVYGNFKISPLYAQSLRNKYSIAREIFSGERNNDFSVFKTVNFVIKRETFRKFPFNEEITHYGYEDYVFAKKMELAKVKFSAINNPVIHIDDTENDVFLTKTETAINSLFYLSKDPRNNGFIKDIKVFRMAKQLKNLKLAVLALFLFKIFEKKMMRNLLSDTPEIKYLDFYKLALLLKRIE